jgi:hypothetical protein
LEVTDMVESRWFRRAGPGIAAIGALVVIASTTSGARPIAWQPPGCAGLARVGAGPDGSWYRIDPTIVDGVRTGQRLSVGAAGTGIRGLDLDPESFAAGPFGGTVLVGTDDGAWSRVSLIDVAGGCAWAVDRSGDVVRRATISPDDGSLIEFRVDRATRGDLGVWRRRLSGRGRDERILPPIDPDDRFGPTWLTELGWSDDGSLLSVQSCGEVACRVRWVDLRTGVTGTVNDPSLGALIGLTRNRLLAHGACRGLPCPIRSVALGRGSAVTIVAAAGQAAFARDARGRPAVIYELDADGRALGSMGLDGTGARVLPVDGSGRRLVAGPAWAGGAAEMPAGWIALGPDGRPPLAGPLDAVFRRVSDGRTVPFGEVPR